MTEWTLLSAFEFGGLLMLWSKIASERNGWNNRALLKDNPHLRVCYYARKWGTPTVFLICTLIANYFFLKKIDDPIELISLNIGVLIVSFLIGLMITETIVARYRNRSYRASRI